MEISVKDKLPEENKLVRVWCTNKEGRKGWGEYKILVEDGITLNWCYSNGGIATELLTEWKPESWEEE